MRTGLILLLLAVASPLSFAQQESKKPLDLSPAFRETALDAFDRLSALPDGPTVPPSVYETKQSEADVLLSKLRRTAATLDERRASESLNALSWQISLCRTKLSYAPAKEYRECLAEKMNVKIEAEGTLGIGPRQPVKRNPAPPAE